MYLLLLILKYKPVYMRLIFILLASFFFSATFGQVPSASKIMNQARTEASASGKNIFIIFHASWCIWCHRMDSAMNEPEMKPLFEKNYIIKHLTVLESDNKKNLENPGAEEMLNEYHGKDQGIPFWLIFDKNGKLLADSRIPNPDGSGGSNTGCPAQPDEVAYFIKVLKNTSSLKDLELNRIKTRFLRIGER